MRLKCINLFVAGHVLAAEIQIIYPKTSLSPLALLSKTRTCEALKNDSVTTLLDSGWRPAGGAGDATGGVCCVFALLFCYYLCLPDITSLLVIFK